MTTLRMSHHGVTGDEMFEIFDDRNNLIGAIYATDDATNGIHIVSKCFDKIYTDDPFERTPGEPEGYLIKFRRSE